MTVNNNIHIHLPPVSEQPYAFRASDMEFAMSKYLENNKADFIRLCNSIYFKVKNKDLREILRIILNHFHNNSKFKRGL